MPFRFSPRPANFCLQCFFVLWTSLQLYIIKTNNHKKSGRPPYLFQNWTFRKIRFQKRTFRECLEFRAAFENPALETVSKKMETYTFTHATSTFMHATSTFAHATHTF